MGGQEVYHFFPPTVAANREAFPWRPFPQGAESFDAREFLA
jgi:hypothetical protein